MKPTDNSKSRRRQFLIQQILDVNFLEGEVAEVGVNKGVTAKLMAEALNGCMLHLFDTFNGMPETFALWDIHKEGDFSNTSLATVKKYLDGYNVKFWPGIFPQSAETLDENIKFKLIHVDVDIYTSTRASCEFFWSRLVKGGIMVFDDYKAKNCPGATHAIDEFFHGWKKIEEHGRKRSNTYPYGTRVIKISREDVNETN